MSAQDIAMSVSICDDPTSPNKTVETCSEVSWSEPAQAYTSSASSPDAWDQQPISRAKQQPQWDHETVNAVLRALTTSKHWPHAVPCLMFEATDSLFKKNIYIYMYSKEITQLMEDAFQDCLLLPGASGPSSWRCPSGWLQWQRKSLQRAMRCSCENAPGRVGSAWIMKHHETISNQGCYKQISVSLRDISTDTASHWQFCLNTTTFTRITSTPKIGNPGYHRRWHRRPAVQWPSTQAWRVSS